MNLSDLTRLLRGIYPATWRLALASVAAYFYLTDAWAPGDLRSFWVFAAVFAFTWAVYYAARSRTIQHRAVLAAKVTVVAAYFYLGVQTNSPIIYAISVLVLAYFVAEQRGKRPERWLARQFGITPREPMPDADAAFWSACDTIGDLARVNILYLQGKIGSRPAYAPGEGIDDETLPLVDVLVAANRAGFYTTGSQPGHDGEWVQNAYVTGFADHSTTLTLWTLLNAQGGLNWRIRRTCELRDTAREGQRLRWGVMRRRDVESFYGEVCSPDAVAALVDGYQIVIEDPTPGRNDALRSLLTRFAGVHRSAARGQDRSRESGQ